MYGIDRTSDNLFCVMSLASNSSFSTSPECVAILFMLVIHVCQSCKGKDFISNSQAKRTPFCREGENLQALLLQNAKCKMQRSEGRAESSLSGYAERRMLSTKVKCKNGGRSEREKHVLSPLGLTFPQNRVLRPFRARFSLGAVVCTAEGVNGDSGAIL